MNENTPDLQFFPIVTTNTTLLEAAYDAPAQECYVKFSSGTYKYSGCTGGNWTKFQETFQSRDSSNAYFRKNIMPLKTEKL